MDALITYYIEISMYKSLNDIYINQHKKVLDAAKNTGIYKQDMIDKMENELLNLKQKGEVLGKIVDELDKTIVFEKIEDNDKGK